ncbi:hypothetical protein [Halarcobacter anaerophilus]|uniref:Uncharacterized protein n=1 Tax=Halarcobacter anaerophilus TaxID=877500 RepID=A0A4Q0XYZ8_9BACT|nr:hypothetical protein [Halarcobacter anaerophilus]QDF30360.1 putative membrane protein [Halarcobacter anaerophilus]RXJ61549.1 hypothetical protein CRV06_13245 [Halarcobacter anaerophilus]
MRNGVYLTLILFLGTLGYQAVQSILSSNNMLLGGVIFLLISLAIGFFATHYKKRVELSIAQKAINIGLIGLFALYGIFTAVSLLTGASIGMVYSVEGILFLVASAILLYSLGLFIKDKLYHQNIA